MKCVKLIGLAIVILGLGITTAGCGISAFLGDQLKDGRSTSDEDGISPDATGWVPNAITPPSGFKVIESGPGVALYRKDYRSGQPDFVIVADLKRARLRSLTGTLIGNRPDYQIRRKSLSDFWQQAHRINSKAFAVFNGAFFSTQDNPTSLAFPLKANGQIIAYGYGTNSEYPGQILTLYISSNSANIRLYANANDLSLANDVIGGLDTYANKSPNLYVGRTFVGLRDDNRDGIFEMLFVFVSASATQAGARSVLFAFGATMQMMLDGGGSSQLIVNGSVYVSSSRTIPHALAIFAGN